MLIRISTFTTIITNVIFEHHNYLHHSRVYQWFWIFFKNNLSKAFTCSIDINSIHLLIKRMTHDN